MKIGRVDASSNPATPTSFLFRFPHGIKSFQTLRGARRRPAPRQNASCRVESVRVVAAKLTAMTNDELQQAYAQLWARVETQQCELRAFEFALVALFTTHPDRQRARDALADAFEHMKADGLTRNYPDALLELQNKTAARLLGLMDRIAGLQPRG